MAFDFNWAQPKLNLQMKGPQAPVYQQPAPQQSQVMQDFMDAERLGGWTNPKQVQPQVPQQPDPAAQRQQQIDSIKSRIQQLESQIAANQAKLQNWQGVDGQIAAIEARKINSQDPTSIWRWKAAQQQREAEIKRVEAEKEKQKEEQDQYLRNKISSTLPTMEISWSTSPEQVQQFRNTLAGLKAEAMNRRLPLDQINEVEARLNEQLPMQQARMAMDNMANAKDLFNLTREEGGFGKDSKAYHDYLLQQYTAITSRYPEAKYDPEFNKMFKEADKLFRKKVKTPKIMAPGRRK